MSASNLTRQMLAALVLVWALSPVHADSDRGSNPLARFVGSWEGTSADDRFQEHVSYRWGPGKSHLLFDMRFFVNGEASGEGSGFMAWDRENDGLVFHFVSSQGAVIHQAQIAGDSTRMELAANAINGGSAGFPSEFRTHFEFTAEDRYETGVWLQGESGEWQQVMANRFRRVAAP